MKIFKQIWKRRLVILTNAMWIEHIEKYTSIWGFEYKVLSFAYQSGLFKMFQSDGFVFIYGSAGRFRRWRNVIKQIITNWHFLVNLNRIQAIQITSHIFDRLSAAYIDKLLRWPPRSLLKKINQRVEHLETSKTTLKVIPEIPEKLRILIYNTWDR